MTPSKAFEVISAIDEVVDELIEIDDDRSYKMLCTLQNVQQMIFDCFQGDEADELNDLFVSQADRDLDDESCDFFEEFSGEVDEVTV